MRTLFFVLLLSSAAFAGMVTTDSDGFATGYTDTIPATAWVNGVPTPITCDVGFSYSGVAPSTWLTDPILTLSCDVQGTDFTFHHDVDALGHFVPSRWDILGAGDGPAIASGTFGIDLLNLSPGDVRSRVPMTGGGQSLEGSAQATVISDYDNDAGGILGTYSHQTIFDFTGPGPHPVTRISANHTASVSAVPEPSSFLMLSLVATLAAGVRRYWK